VKGWIADATIERVFTLYAGVQKMGHRPILATGKYCSAGSKKEQL